MGQQRWVACALCAKEVDPDALGTYQWTAGWVQRRAGGGGNAVACAVREPRFAHPACVDRATRGELGQAGLFGEGS